jgi:hypothetical protein
MKKLPRYYSGRLSKSFWKRVNKTNSPKVYSLACCLQDIEEIMLSRILLAMLDSKMRLTK